MGHHKPLHNVHLQAGRWQEGGWADSWVASPVRSDARGLLQARQRARAAQGAGASGRQLKQQERPASWARLLGDEGGLALLGRSQALHNVVEAAEQGSRLQAVGADAWLGQRQPVHNARPTMGNARPTHPRTQPAQAQPGKQLLPPHLSLDARASRLSSCSTLTARRAPLSTTPNQGAYLAAGTDRRYLRYGAGAGPGQRRLRAGGRESPPLEQCCGTLLHDALQDACRHPCSASRYE